MGKLHCAEYCLGAPGGDDAWPFARNPHDTARTPGASSSGSAVALAAGMVPAALGSDTGGSIRIPAAFRGITGLKPTGGLVPTKGVFPLAPSLDQAGPMARDSRDCALLIDALTGKAHAQALEEPLDGVRIGRVTHFGAEARAGDAQRGAVDAASAALGALGATLRDVTLPPLQAFTDCFLALMLSEAWTLHANPVAMDASMSDNSRIRLSGGATLGPEQVAAARAARPRLAAAMEDALREVDLFIYEAVPGDPPFVADIEALDYLAAPMLAVPANLADMPALVTRCGTSPAGLPLNVQIVGPSDGDALVLRIGHAIEKVFNGEL